MKDSDHAAGSQWFCSLTFNWITVEPLGTSEDCRWCVHAQFWQLCFSRWDVPFMSIWHFIKDREQYWSKYNLWFSYFCVEACWCRVFESDTGNQQYLINLTTLLQGMSAVWKVLFKVVFIQGLKKQQESITLTSCIMEYTVRPYCMILQKLMMMLMLLFN